MREKLKVFIENKFVTNFILTIIILNSILLGLLTYPELSSKFGPIMQLSCFVCVIIFTIEMLIKLYVYKKDFFTDGWNNFDFILVAMSWIPTGGAFSSFRAFRILRVLRLVTRLKKLRIIVQAIIESIPNVGWVTLLLLLIFYIFAIMGTTLYAEHYPEYFGSIGKSMFSLLQIMTLDDWAAGMARRMLEHYPSIWVYFTSFILTSTFIVMNVIVGVIVNAIEELNQSEKQEQNLKALQNADSELEIELIKLKEQIAIVEKLIK